MLMSLLLSASLWGCGMEPIFPPFGCNGKPVCVCNYDKCEWVWICE